MIMNVRSGHQKHDDVIDEDFYQAVDILRSKFINS